MLQFQNWPISMYLLLITTLILLIARIVWQPPFPLAAPPLLKESLPIVGALRFFSARANFCKDGASKTKTGNYSFYFGKYRIVGLSGVEGRKTFYQSKDFSLFEGYAALLTATPNVNVEENGTKFDVWFLRKITTLMKKDNLVKGLRFLVSDTSSALNRVVARCGTGGGIFDPFDEMNRIVYHLTMRTVGTNEIAESQELLDRSLHLVEVIDDNNSTARIMFPWLLTLKHVKRLVAAGRMYLMINRILRDRRRTGRREDDAVQLLLDEGASTTRIFVINGLLVAKHRISPEQTPLDILGKLTLDDWESDFPLTNLCLHESIRLQTVGTAFRKNVSGRDVQIGNTSEVVPKDGFAAFHLDDIHMNPDIYSDPTKFDPARYLPDRAEDKKVPLAYGGWGIGRHPCCGLYLSFL
ncbi:cytochrome P450 6A1 [Melanomma pulvis-pyrius CBS 109.77]|uniref:Cytochrome P450 6A1 n=1 Tax=Melanomma pulvis-pyrius CBS 109.77 TaxID=1314802 RepID=A0A6A6XLI1_9PLEO|nr:cytochrome P450 6A1 [Melanomma pulvis-pyrius CBS 109.77]